MVKLEVGWILAGLYECAGRIIVLLLASALMAALALAAAVAKC